MTSCPHPSSIHLYIFLSMPFSREICLYLSKHYKHTHISIILTALIPPTIDAVQFTCDGTYGVFLWVNVESFVILMLNVIRIIWVHVIMTFNCTAHHYKSIVQHPMIKFYRSPRLWLFLFLMISYCYRYHSHYGVLRLIRTMTARAIFLWTKEDHYKRINIIDKTALLFFMHVIVNFMTYHGLNCFEMAHYF